MPTEMKVATRIMVMAIAPPSTANVPVMARAGLNRAKMKNKAVAKPSLFILAFSADGGERV